MGTIKNIKWMPLLMSLTILVIAGFQVYWITKTYEREERTLDMRTNVLFRETIRTVQAAKLKLDRLNADSGNNGRIFAEGELNGRPVVRRTLPKEKMISMMDVIM